VKTTRNVATVVPKIEIIRKTGSGINHNGLYRNTYFHSECSTQQSARKTDFHCTSESVVAKYSEEHSNMLLSFAVSSAR
jgi:hypothetical protein